MRSALEHLASVCSSTVLPVPKPPGRMADPPMQTGKSVSSTPLPGQKRLGWIELSLVGARTLDGPPLRHRHVESIAKADHRVPNPACAGKHLCDLTLQPRRRQNAMNPPLRLRHLTQHGAAFKLIPGLYLGFKLPEALGLQCFGGGATQEKGAVGFPQQVSAVFARRHIPGRAGPDPE